MEERAINQNKTEWTNSDYVEKKKKIMGKRENEI
jgi:hypothetical protein